MTDQTKTEAVEATGAGDGMGWLRLLALDYGELASDYPLLHGNALAAKYEQMVEARRKLIATVAARIAALESDLARLTAENAALRNDQARLDMNPHPMSTEAVIEGVCAKCFQPITVDREIVRGRPRRVRLSRTCACDGGHMLFRPSPTTLEWLSGTAAPQEGRND